MAINEKRAAVLDRANRLQKSSNRIDKRIGNYIEANLDDFMEATGED